MNFSRDLSLGRNGEKFLQNYLIKNGIDCKLNEVNNADYDLICKYKRTKFTIEVKYDMYAEKSGNIAIEYYNPQLDKPSGLYSTKADLWCTIIPDFTNKTMWCCTVKKFKKYIETHKPYRIVENCGDGNANIYLYKLDDIMDLFIRLDRLTEDKLIKAIRKILKDK
ncbi:MAG: hypothetical protein ACFFG0_27375 [Candidatus Thorarchaeota archaeon]